MKTKKEWFPNPRPIILVVMGFMVFICFMSALIIGQKTKKLSDYRTIIDTIESSSLVVFKEKEWRSKGIGYRIVDKPRVVIKLKNFDRLILIDQSTYSEFFPALLNKENTGKKAKIHLLAPGGEQYNPVQIEINNQIILPYNFQEKWDTYALIVFAAILLLCLFFLVKLFKIYSRKHLKNDKYHWSGNLGMKLKVIGVWTGIMDQKRYDNEYLIRY